MNMHVATQAQAASPADIPNAPLWYWINERHAIYLRKAKVTRSRIPAWADPAKLQIESDWSPDYLTHDAVLGQNRFCNVFRELDRVTIWIRQNIRKPYADHPLLWFMLCMARYINEPATLAELIASGDGWPDHAAFTPERVTQILEARAARNEKVFTGAYIISPGGSLPMPWRDWSKERKVAELYLGRLWADRVGMTRHFERDKLLWQAWDRFRHPRYLGWGSGGFMAYEVVTDMRHTRYLRNATDIMRWANAGKGALRGINRLRGRPPTQAMKSYDPMIYMQGLLAQSRTGVLAPWVPPLEMRDIEHSLCEVDKYLRVRDDGGSTRASYVPGRGH
jgi:hypothetical protein